MDMSNNIQKIGKKTVLLLVSLFLFSFVISHSWNPEPYELLYPSYFGGNYTIPKNNPLTKEGVYLGRMLFYETKLSDNNKISCASCHIQKLAFTDGKQFSSGVDGTLTKRNAMSLTNLLWVKNLFWDGRSNTLEEQAVFPLTDKHEMGRALNKSAAKLKNTAKYPSLFKKAFGSVEITEDRIVKAIAQFERTLISSNSLYDQYLNGTYTPTEQELLGLNLFMTAPKPKQHIRGANCAHCHGSPKLFKNLFHNNGLDTLAKDIGRMEFTGQEMDLGRFRVPTLRNIALTAPYMHDGRFNTLEEVLDHYNTHIKPSKTLSTFISNVSNDPDGKSLSLSEAEKNAIISFLKLLTDETFVTNPEFSDPHMQP